MKNLQIIFLLILCSLHACKKTDKGGAAIPPPPAIPGTFAKGADVSWLTYMEAAGIKFYNTAGTKTEGIALVKSLGMNTIRLRVWVNPMPAWNNTADVLAKALRAKNLGMRIMIDFNYSDTLADPGKQTRSAAWAGQDFATLKLSLANHTTAVHNELKNNNVTSEWVQVGNETNNGMLWPDGKASVSMSSFAQLINAGYNAVKSVFPTTKVIVHVSNGHDNSLFRWMFDGLKNNGAKYDVIAMSLYPSPANRATLNSQYLANMNDMVARCNKEVMVAKVGMSWDSPDECKLFFSGLITKVKSVTGSKGTGVIYWEPQAYHNFQGYTLGAFDNSGKPTMALSVFQ